MGKICGTTPIHIAKAFETLPFMAVLPSDMGFPVVIETQATFFVHMKGELKVDCAVQGFPAFVLKTYKKFAYSWSGYAGVVSPFGDELLAAGVDTHRAINFPFMAEINVRPTTGTVLIDLKQVEKVTPQTAIVDLHHFHIIPFTTKKPIVMGDLIPVVLDRRYTKIIKTTVPRKNFEMIMGEKFGLHVKLLVESEADLIDRKFVIDTMKKFKFNPYIAFLFLGAETALKADGTPTLRYHKYKLVHNPLLSTTKQLRAEIKLAAALKRKEADIVHLIARESDMKVKQEQKLTHAIRGLRAEAAFATNVFVKFALIGGVEKTFDVFFTFAHGFTQLENKWNLHLELEKDVPWMFCVKGGLVFPLRMNNQERLKFTNRFGFGTTCDQFFVNMEGFAVTSEKQIEHSRTSVAAKKCAKLEHKVHEKYEYIKTLPLIQRKFWLLQELAQMRKKKMFFCAEKIWEATTLDKVEVDITTSPTLPVHFFTFAKYLDAGMKAFLMEYLHGLPIVRNTVDTNVKLVIFFKRWLGALNMKVVSPMDLTEFKNIRLPFWMKKILPITFSRTLIEQFYTGLTGTRLFPKCVVFPGQIMTFDKKTYSYDLDDCNHIVASDCLKKTHAVLAKKKDGVAVITIFHGETKIMLAEPALKYLTRGVNFVVMVNGERKEVVPMETGTWEVIWARNGRHAYYIHWSKFNKVIVDTPAHRVAYNGKELTVEDKFLVRLPHCGLCGDNNMDKRKDLKSPGMCVYRSFLAFAHSYRIKDTMCVTKILPEHERILKEEKTMCAQRKARVIPKMGVMTELVKEPVLKHLILHQANRICISKMRMPQCLYNFVAKTLKKMTVEFVCVAATHPHFKTWFRMIERKEEIIALKTMVKTFAVEMEVAGTCLRF